MVPKNTGLGVDRAVFKSQFDPRPKDLRHTNPDLNHPKTGVTEYYIRGYFEVHLNVPEVLGAISAHNEHFINSCNDDNDNVSCF